jgi:hypothetical protein
VWRETTLQPRKICTFTFAGDKQWAIGAKHLKSCTEAWNKHARKFRMKCLPFVKSYYISILGSKPTFRRTVLPPYSGLEIVMRALHCCPPWEVGFEPRYYTTQQPSKPWLLFLRPENLEFCVLGYVWQIYRCSIWNRAPKWITKLYD